MTDVNTPVIQSRDFDTEEDSLAGELNPGADWRAKSIPQLAPQGSTPGYIPVPRRLDVHSGL